MTAVELAKKVVATEVAALERMLTRLDDSFERAVCIIQEMRGRVVILGMGKSGIIGKKIAATMASTGTPSFFVHPGEAFHGDLGMLRPMDVALLISNSGETEELIRLLPFFEDQKIDVVAMTGNLQSTLAKHAKVVLDISVHKEACCNNLAPTCSTTATLVMGDALAVTLSTLRGFQPEDFARFHPGGNLGRRLLTRVGDVMRSKGLPVCQPQATLREVIHTISDGRLGLALVMDGSELQGVVTDGDIRRAFDQHEDPLSLVSSQIMTPQPKVIAQGERFCVAEEMMRDAKINSLVVVNEMNNVVGVLQIYDLNSSASVRK